MEEEFKGKIIVDDTTYETYLTKNYLRRKQIVSSGNAQEITAFIPGVIKEIYVHKGDKVYKGQPLLILEAMKMKNRVFAPRDGVIEDVFVKIDEKVSKSQLLIKYSN